MDQCNQSKSGMAVLNYWLIRQAARNAPAEFAPRLEEEWLADLEQRVSPLSRLRFALGCCWAAAIIARELGAPVPAMAQLATVGGATLPSERKLRYLTLRPATLFLILGLHAALFWGLSTLLPLAP